MDLRTQLQQHLGSAFVVERELGGGGMSRVFLATEQRLARKVVIKVLAPELAAGINADRFEREILLAASLQQANIVPVLAAGEIAGLPYFTMPFIEGDSLRNRVSQGGLPVAEVVGILRDVTRALVYAHERGVVHRDIKPDNVLISGATAVVTDFGIAKALSASRTGEQGTTLTSVGTTIGTPAYMAPEQVAGDPSVDHRVDLYALGCLAYELLTGQSPFGHLPPQKMLAAHLSQEARPVRAVRPDCPPALEAMVLQLLAKDPAERPQQATDVLRTLDEGVSSQSVQVQPRSLAGMVGSYAAAAIVVALLAKAAVNVLALPEWVFSGAVAMMVLGLPFVLITAWASHTARKVAVATPTVTPGGTVAPHGTMSTLAVRANRVMTWRRMVRSGVVAISAFVLLVIGFVVTRSMGIGPAGSLFAAGRLSADDPLLLADFTVPPEDSALGPIVVEAVRAAMSQSRSIRMLSPADVLEALALMERPPDTRLDAKIANEIAARTGASAILGGRIARAGEGYLVSLELTAAQSGAPLANYQGTAGSAGELLGVVDDLSRKLRGKVGESLRQVQRSVPLERATTESLEALRLFTEGSRAHDVDRDYDKAVRLLREAVKIDSTFALAWRKLAASLANAGLSPLASDSAMEQAVRYVDKLPLRERHLVLGAYYQNHTVHNHRGKALTEYRALYDLDSNEAIAANQLAIIYLERHQHDSAVRYLRRRQELSPSLFNAIGIARTLVTMQRLDEAERMLDSLRVASPGAEEHPRFGAALSRLAYSRGDIAAARAALDSSEARTAETLSRINTLGEIAVLDRIAGKVASSYRIDAEIGRVLRGLGSPYFEELGRANDNIHLRGNLQAAISGLDRYVNSEAWRAMPASQRPYRVAALLYAEAGAPAKARRMLELNRQEDPDGYEAFSDHNFKASAEGMILLAEGRYDEALEQVRAARYGPDGEPAGCLACLDYMMARVHDAANQPDSAIAWLEKYLAEPPSQRFNSDGAYLATIRRRLGELYDQRGDREKAMHQYSAFLEQWAEADADLQPFVRSVRERLNELINQEAN